MKWVTLLKEIKEKVGLNPSQSSSFETSSATQNDNAVQRYSSWSSTREKHELEQDFKSYWEKFRSSSSEKEKEAALNITVDIFCRLVKQDADPSKLIAISFVTDIKKLKICSRAKSLNVQELLEYFSAITEDGINPGSNLLTTLKILVSAPIDKQSLLDSGILSCMSHILYGLLDPSEEDGRHKACGKRNTSQEGQSFDGQVEDIDRLEVEGSVVHIMKVLVSHSSAGQSLIEDDSLQMLFWIVANGSLAVTQNKDGLVPLHNMQLHRHAMQILGLLLANNNGSTSKYIRKHHLIKVLLTAVKDFNPDYGDSTYIIGIVDLLCECVSLSYRPEAGGVRLREDLHNGHGYQFFVQFALILSSTSKSQKSQSIKFSSTTDRITPLDDCEIINEEKEDFGGSEGSSAKLSPVLFRLLDVLMKLAQTGTQESTGKPGDKGQRSSHKGQVHSTIQASSVDKPANELQEKGNEKVKDLEAVQLLQDIFLKSDRRELQAEVLSRLFNIFLSHPENYKLCQPLRIIPLLITNMAEFPAFLQDAILKILDYAATVINCVPDQELLSLCLLLRQPISSELKCTIISFLLKLLSFDQKYKDVLREVGALEVLLDDLKQHHLLLCPDQQSGKSSSGSFKNDLNNEDVSLSSPEPLESSLGKHIFEVDKTIPLAWDCMVSLLKKSESNQMSFRSAKGFFTTLPFLVSNTHRHGVLKILTCLIIDDAAQVHVEELNAVVDILRGGIIISVSGSQYKLPEDAKCELFGALWRILRVNKSAQKVFGEVSGFSLLHTSLQNFQNDELASDQCDLMISLKIFTYLMRVITAGVRDHAVNRLKLHLIILSQNFSDLLSKSGLLSVEFEKQVIKLFLELALEIVVPPYLTSDHCTSADFVETKSSCFVLNTPSGLYYPDRDRVYNAEAVRVLIKLILLFTPKVQFELLQLVGKLASAGSFNQENLTSVGCGELLLETIEPFLFSSSPLVAYVLKIVEILGAYRLSASELRLLLRYILRVRFRDPGHLLAEMMERLITMEAMALDNDSLAPFVVMDMSKIGHASIQVSLGERSWPPVAGYSFVCWFQFKNFLKSQSNETQTLKRLGFSTPKQQERKILRLFSVGSADFGNQFYTELCLQEDGVLTLATSRSLRLSFSITELEEGRWHHLAVVHSKPNALTGLFQASIAYVYLDGKLKHTGKLGYSLSPPGKKLQVTIGTPVTCSRASDLAWKLRSCYLFEEVLTPGCIFFMHILGRGYRGLFQDTDLLRFVPSHACGGDSLSILDSINSDFTLVPNMLTLDGVHKQGDFKLDGSEIVWELEGLRNFCLQLSVKKLIFAFDGTCKEDLRTSPLCMLNLVDPMSSAASPMGGIPRFGYLHGDIHICTQSAVANTLRPVGGVSVVLALVEAAETSDMLHMALTLLGCALHLNPHNVRDIQTCRGYHLLALFLHRKMPLFHMRSLEIFFKIAACEASFSELRHAKDDQTLLPAAATLQKTGLGYSLIKSHDDVSSVGSQGDIDGFSEQKDPYSHIQESEYADMPAESSNCVVLSNAEMVEHVLLDWTLWAIAPISIQIALTNFLEHLVSMHRYRNHNLTILRQINLVRHLLVTLQRDDVEVPVLERLVVLLGVILEDGFLASELEIVVKFVIMTFDPPALMERHSIPSESMGKHIIVRNMLLEMLIDLQVTINSQELVEKWHKIVSSKLITYFIDEAVHPSSMKLVMTLLGVCLSSSLTFDLKFRVGGGYQSLARVLPKFHGVPDIYYIIFCLVLGRPVYPRVPEVRMLDFHALLPSDGRNVDVKFVEILESVVAMAKSSFDRLTLQLLQSHEAGTVSQDSADFSAQLAQENVDLAAELQGEALVHKTYGARLMGGEASAPVAATSVLRFMVDLAKMCPAFSASCRREDFLESCVDLYFSCVRCAYALKGVKELSEKIDDERSWNDCENAKGSEVSSSAPLEEDQYPCICISVVSFPQGRPSVCSEDIAVTYDKALDNAEIKENPPVQEINKPVGEDIQVVRSLTFDCAEQEPAPSSTEKLSSHSVKDALDRIESSGSQNSAFLSLIDSPILSEESDQHFCPSSLPIMALMSLGSTSHSECRFPLVPAASTDSSSCSMECDSSSDLKPCIQGPSASNALISVCPSLLLEIDDVGYGGGPCFAGATAALDFLAEVLSGLLAEQIKASQVLGNILENVPLYVGNESVLIFQGLCLTRLINFLERRLLLDDEENKKKLDKTQWSSNLDVFCWMIVDRVYMGAFPKPAGVLRILDFLLSMLQLANKDGCIEEGSLAGKSVLSISRGSRQLDAYIYSLLKNTNRMILYCFLPSFLLDIGEKDLLFRLGLPNESFGETSTCHYQDISGIDISTVLQFLVSYKSIIFSPRNNDSNINCCLCVNLIGLLRDQRKSVQNLAVDVLKYLLHHRRTALEELLVSRPQRRYPTEVSHNGFDLLMSGSLFAFVEWLQNSYQAVNKVLENGAAMMWAQYIAGSAKFPGVRVKGMESRRKTEVGRKARDISKLDLRHWEYVNERRYALEMIRGSMSTELRILWQNKYGWILHAESEWQSHLQQLIHERGIFPILKSPSIEDPDWRLCSIEGPYRMRKKLERCRPRIYGIQNVLDGHSELEEALSNDRCGGIYCASNPDSESFFQLLTESAKQNSADIKSGDESLSKEPGDIIDESSVGNGWDGRGSCINDTILPSAPEIIADSGLVSIADAESIQGGSDPGSPRQSSVMKIDDADVVEDEPDKELRDNGEFLIRPYLEPLEKIRFKYNCERIVGLDKHDGIFLIGELCLYVIENFYVDNSGRICEKECEDELSVIDQALGVKKDVTGRLDLKSKSTLPWITKTKSWVGGRAWAYNGGAWGKEKACGRGSLSHPWHMWKVNSVHEILKREYQLRPVAVEIFSIDGCNDLLVFHKKERDEVFRNLIAMNLRRNMLDATISGLAKQESNEGTLFSKMMAKSFSERWQNGEISNFQYLMHLNTLAGRGYSDLTQYPVFPWILSDYESETLDLSDPKTFRKLDKPMGCQTPQLEEEFKKRYDGWNDPEVPKFHYGSHYSSAGIVLFYLVRLPPFSEENQKLQGGQFDHADRLFNGIRDTWLSASGKRNTSDVKELIPEFFYLPEFLENRFNLDLGQKQSGEKVGDVVLPPWAKGSAREFIRKHREALESDFVSENLHNWIDLIFGYKQRGKAAVEAVNLFYHLTYEGSVDIDSVTDPETKVSILAQINHFGQTPKQLFSKPHIKRRVNRRVPPHPLKNSNHLVPNEIRKSSPSISQIVSFHEKVLVAGKNKLLKPKTYSKYVAWGFPDRSLRFLSYDQDRLLSVHENLHEGNEIHCASLSQDGRILVTGADDGLALVWRIRKRGPRVLRCLQLEGALCGHTAKITCLHVSQPYMLVVTGSDDCTVILWDLSSLAFVRQLPKFPAPISALYVNDLTGEIVTASGTLLVVWSINGDCLAMVNTSPRPSDSVISVAGSTFSDWLDTNWFVTGHQGGAIRVWQMVHSSSQQEPSKSERNGIVSQVKEAPEYKLILNKLLKSHKHPVTALHLPSGLPQLLSGDSGGHLLSWTLPSERRKTSSEPGMAG